MDEPLCVMPESPGWLFSAFFDY